MRLEDGAEVDPATWGIEPGYHDVDGNWHEAPEHAVGHVLQSMGAAVGRETPGPPSTWVVRRSDVGMIELPLGELHLEDGTSVTIGATGHPPIDVPLGYHEIVAADGWRTLLVVTPGLCPVPHAKSWGWALQLYALRSARACGIGDLGTLREFGEWARELGAGFTIINPLHAPLPGVPQQPSPYFASSRVTRNPLFIDIEELAEHLDLSKKRGVDLKGFRKRAQALSTSEQLDRDPVWNAKMPVLEQLFAHAGDHDTVDRWATDRQVLVDHALFGALSEKYGRPWLQWPSEVRHPSSPGVQLARTELADRIRFQVWLQFHIERQLIAANEVCPIIGDLAVGGDRAGADAWLWQDFFVVDGTRVGCPPDKLGPDGQDWGCPPLDPWRLRDARYQPFIHIVRSALTGVSGLRIDHVMGLFRLFWIPGQLTAKEGVYVRYPAEDLLGIVALEAVRAGTFVVGEDLGTVEARVQDSLAEHRMLSYKLLLFSDTVDESTFPEYSFGALTTHDLPTLAGVLDGSDIDAQESILANSNRAEFDAMQVRFKQLARDRGFDPGSPNGIDEITAAAIGAYGALADASSMLVSAAIDDAFGTPLRPNIPSTIDEWPNWRIPLPGTLDDLRKEPRAAAIATAIGWGRHAEARASVDEPASR